MPIRTITGGSKSFGAPTELGDTDSSSAFKESYREWQEEKERKRFEEKKTWWYRIKKFFRR